jgi:tetratricopeptide (TPR) repeat protein
MRCWLHLVLLCVLSGALWAQQNSTQPPPPPSSSSAQDASGLSRDTTFPEDDPAQPAPAKDAGKGDPAKNDPANNGPTKNDAANKRSSSMTPPRSDRVQVDDLGPGVGESSSKDTQVDLSPPADDAKAHPESSAAVANAEAETSNGGVTEFHTWDPHKAAKSLEVGDFYYRRRNYRAAEDRYREALRFKDNDAVATIKLAVCLEKLGILDDARAEYESYLRILPHGPQAGEAQKAIARLKVQSAGIKPAQ